MIRLTHIRTFDDIYTVDLHTDGQTCVSARIDYTHKPSPLYWFFQDDQFNEVLQIGVDRNNGRVVSFTALNYQQEIFPICSDYESDPEKDSIGVPVFDLDLWGSADKYEHEIKHTYYVYPGRFRLECGEGRLCVVMFSDQISYSIRTKDMLKFSFNKKAELCSVTAFY
jgi:hypothetical protein